MAGKLKGSGIVDASVTEVQLSANINASLALAANVYNQANAAYAQANGATSLAQTAYNQASLAYTAANNSGNTVAVTTSATTVYNKKIKFTNTPTIVVNVSDEGPDANITIDSIATDVNAMAAIYTQANNAYNQANVAIGFSYNNTNSVNQINYALGVMNSATQAAHNDANNAYNFANTSYILAIIADNQADAGREQANNARDTANSAYAQANAAYIQANAAYIQANTGIIKANLAYDSSNAAANTTSVSQNSSTLLFGRRINFVNTANIGITLTDAGNGVANVIITGFSGNFVRLANDSTTNTTAYLVFTTNTSGNLLSTNVATNKLTFNPNTGILSATTFNSLSDIKHKENVETLLNAVEMLLNLRGVKFNWKETGNPSMGIIAQELLNVAPELVNTEPAGGIMTVNYSGINAILIEAMKSMYSEIKELRAEVEKLKNVSSIK